MCASALLGNRGGATQLRIDVCVDLSKGMHDFRRLISGDNIDGVNPSRLIFKNKLSARLVLVRPRRHYQGRHLGWKQRSATNAYNEKGENFSHKERVLSSISATSASDF